MCDSQKKHFFAACWAKLRQFAVSCFYKTRMWSISGLFLCAVIAATTVCYCQYFSIWSWVKQFIHNGIGTYQNMLQFSSREYYKDYCNYMLCLCECITVENAWKSTTERDQCRSAVNAGSTLDVSSCCCCWVPSHCLRSFIGHTAVYCRLACCLLNQWLHTQKLDQLSQYLKRRLTAVFCSPLICEHMLLLHVYSRIPL